MTSTESEVVPTVVFAADHYVGSQVLTIAIPLGTLFLVMLWGFFQRNPHR